MRVIEVVPGLSIGTRLSAETEYATLGVDAIVDLEDWEFAWVPPVPTGCIYLSFPIEDEEPVDPKVREVAGFVASLVRSGRHVLVHCTEGLNRSGIVVGRAMLDLGWSVADAIHLTRDRRGQPRTTCWLFRTRPSSTGWRRRRTAAPLPRSE